MKPFLIIKPNEEKTLFEVEGEYEKNSDIFTINYVLENSVDIEKYKTIIDLNNKEESLCQFIEGIKKFNQDISFSAGTFKYMHFDYVNIFVNPTLKKLTEDEKAEIEERQESIMNFLQKTFVRNEDVPKNEKNIEKNDILKIGLRLDEMINSKSNKKFFLVATKDYVKEDKNSEYITLEELEMINTVHLEALSLLCTE